MGKTEFLKQDLAPAAKAHNYTVVYTNLWDLEMDPATVIVSELYRALKPKGVTQLWEALKSPGSRISTRVGIPGILSNSIETHLVDQKTIGTLLMQVMKAFDKTPIEMMILIIDEAQVLAYEENAYFAHALRAALDIRKDRIKVIFAGSSETTLRRMFGVPSEPFYNWAPLEPFELLGTEFVETMVNKVNQISKFPLGLKEALHAFSTLKNTPEFFRRYIEYYINNPLSGPDDALEMTKNKVFSDKGFQQQWESLLPIDKILLQLITQESYDLHSKATLELIDQRLGIKDGISKNSIQNALRRLQHKNMITKIQYGIYQFEDEVFSDWVKHLD
ncbi:MAG: hypothetical protein QM752_05255 [Gammaproteobacteria bacterium]